MLTIILLIFISSKILIVSTQNSTKCDFDRSRCYPEAGTHFFVRNFVRRNRKEMLAECVAMGMQFPEICTKADFDRLLYRITYTYVSRTFFLSSVWSGQKAYEPRRGGRVNEKLTELIKSSRPQGMENGYITFHLDNLWGTVDDSGLVEFLVCTDPKSDDGGFCSPPDLV